MNSFVFFTIKSSLCLSAGYLLYCMFFRHETFHRLKRIVLLGIVCVSLVVPLIRLKVDPVGMNLGAQKLESSFFIKTPAKMTVHQPGQTAVKEQSKSNVNYFLLVYLAGATFQMILLLTSLARIILILRKSEKFLYKGFRLALVPEGIVPFCFGRLIGVSEHDFRKHGPEILLHEQTHLKSGHWVDLLLMEIYLVMTWYNPASWMLRHELKQNHEFEADNNVLRHGADESEYQLLLLRTAVGEYRYHMASHFSQSTIKNRIKMMNKRKSNSLATLKVLLFIPLIALMVQVFAQKKFEKSGEGTTENSPGKFIELAPRQLKMLGFELNSTGLFYKNMQSGRSDQGVLCLYFTDAIYSCSIVLRPGDKIKGNSEPLKMLKKQPLTSFDFYPVVVSSYSGYRTLDMSAAETSGSEGLLPVQISMAELTMGKRSDTLVFWFKPTASLKRILSSEVSTDEFLQTCPDKKRKAGSRE